MELKEIDVQKRIEEIDNQVQEIENEADAKINKLKEERWELEKHNKHLYVAKLVTGDYDYWNEWFCPLGEVTEAYAKQWIRDHVWEEDACRDPDAYYEVSKGEYAILEKLQRAYEARKAVSYSGIPMAEEIEKLLFESEKKLAEQTTLITHPSFQHVVDAL